MSFLPYHADLEAGGGGENAVLEVKALKQTAEGNGKDRGQHDGRQHGLLEVPDNGSDT